MAYAIKVELPHPDAATYAFAEQKTMYSGKHIADGDVLYLFASGNGAGSGLVAAAILTSAVPTPRDPDIERQTPRVSITARRIALARRPLGRRELKPFTRWGDGRPETELNFKLYRQATDKIVGITDATAAFLRGFFDDPA